uniref:Uncharacterized protein n=1 Tax=Anguilla anguilla TaxID=7936 RepID=A0A0E9RCZ0_ANGAN
MFPMFEPLNRPRNVIFYLHLSISLQCFSLTLITSDLPSASSQITQFYRGFNINPKTQGRGAE